jgi:hypothetical protein
MNMVCVLKVPIPIVLLVLLEPVLGRVITINGIVIYN